MKKILFLLFNLMVFISCNSKLSSQEIIENLSIEMCECIESAEYKNADEIGPCYDKVLGKNRSIIQEYYETNKLSESQVYEFGNKISAKTLDNCNYVKDNFPTGIFGETRSKQLNVNCEDLKDGSFYYLTQRPNSGILDTTFVTISKDVYLEKMRNRTTYSRSKIIWKDNCTYDLIFEKSNDPFKKELLQEGQIFNYEIIANEKESFFVEVDWEGRVYQYQIFKGK